MCLFVIVAKQTIYTVHNNIQNTSKTIARTQKLHLALIEKHYRIGFATRLLMIQFFWCARAFRFVSSI